MIYDFTFANNVVYNWRHRTVDGGDHRNYYNIINNYLNPGPTTPRDEPIAHRILKPESRRSPHFNADFGRAYVSGNIVEGNDAVTADNWNGGAQVDLADGFEPGLVLPQVRINKPYPGSFLEIESAQDAYEHVLAGSGATRPKRDAVDQRIAEMVRTGTVTYKKGEGIITDVEQVGGYPDYSGQPYADADSDGMPDEWERQHRLDPKTPPTPRRTRTAMATRTSKTISTASIRMRPSSSGRRRGLTLTCFGTFLDLFF